MILIPEISFIVIGRNEGWKITKCLQSVFLTIKQNNIEDFEVIYVDSKSTDDSIQRAIKFDSLKVIQLTGDCNAAIARNVGASFATGRILFFLDGDMELLPTAWNKFFNNKNDLHYPFMSGNLLYQYYDSAGKELKKKTNPHYELGDDKFMTSLGGLFFIERNIWNKVGGFKNYLKAGEDGDLSIRLRKIGLKLLRKKDVLVIHHTIDYLSESRKWSMLFSGKYLYSKSLLYRNHFFYKEIFKRLFRHDYSCFMLFLSLCTINISYGILVFYLFISLIKTILKNGNLISNYVFFMLRDIQVLVGFFFFFPSQTKKINFIQIQ